jgi:hypothetical protein
VLPPKPEATRLRPSSNDKKYNYYNEVSNSREFRPRTPSASEHNKSRYDPNCAAMEGGEFGTAASFGTLRRQGKFLGAWLGNSSFGEGKGKAPKEDSPGFGESHLKENSMNLRN